MIESDYERKLYRIRQQIDKVDDAIYDMIATRMYLISDVGELKKKYGVIEMSQERREEILLRLKTACIKDRMPVSTVIKIFEQLIDASVLTQEIIFNDKMK